MMKVFLKYSIFIAAVTIALMLATLQLVDFRMNDDINKDMLHSSIYNKPNNFSDVTLQQLKAQLSYFRKVLDELGATSAIQAARLWAKGKETRNGIYRYAVACENLQQKLINELGDPEESFWNIGASSPWLHKYELLNIEEVNETTYSITVKYYWATSTGPVDPTNDTLTIVKNSDYWCVKDVE